MYNIYICSHHLQQTWHQPGNAGYEGQINFSGTAYKYNTSRVVPIVAPSVRWPSCGTVSVPFLFLIKPVYGHIISQSEQVILNTPVLLNSTSFKYIMNFDGLRTRHGVARKVLANRIGVNQKKIKMHGRSNK